MNYYNSLLLLITLSVIQPQGEFVNFLKEESSIEVRDHKFIAQLVFQVQPGYYIQADTGVPENIVPTSVRFEKNRNYHISNYSFKIASIDTVILDKTIYRVISDKFLLEIDIQPNKKLTSQTLKGVLKYQACNNRQCFFPRNLPFEIKL